MISRRVRRKTRSYVYWLYYSAKLCEISGIKKESECAMISRRVRRKTRSYFYWLYDSAKLCKISGIKKKALHV